MQSNIHTKNGIIPTLVVKENLISRGDAVFENVTINGQFNYKQQNEIIYSGEVLSDTTHRLNVSKLNPIMVYPHAVNIHSYALIGMDFEFVNIQDELVITIANQQYTIKIYDWNLVPDLINTRCILQKINTIRIPAAEPITVQFSCPNIFQSAYVTVILYTNC